MVLLTLGILMVVTGGMAVAAAYSYYTQDLPSPDKLQDRQVFRSTKILDRNGRLLYEMFDPRAGKRTNVKLSEISPYLIKATIAIEDSSFYENPGINVRGILRAAWVYVRGDEQIQGGSSITQQLIKQVLLTPEVSIQRKIQEMILAYRVNQQYTKDQILEWYLNENNYGNMSYGIEAAAESYFGIHASELDLAESSMLAGLPQAPALLSPLVDPTAAKRRQRMVLDAMVRNDDITEKEAEAAANEPLDYQPMKFGIEAPHFVMYVRSLLEKKYTPQQLYSAGLTVTTTLDLDMQHEAERIARQQVAKLEKSNIHNAALVAIQPSTGEILAMLGSVDYFNPAISGQVNIATSDRQPGSTFKPITYSAAFEKGWGTGTVILDNYTVFRDRNNQPYTPKNVDNKFHGPVTVRTALSNSMNIPAVKTLEFVGVKNAIDQAHKMGITSLDPSKPWDLSITLGGGEVKLLDLTYAYSVFANGGVMYGQPVPPEEQRPDYREVEPVSILRVEDDSGRVLDEYAGPDRVDVLSPQVSYMITNILSDNVARTPLFGANSPLVLSRPAAVKTGTTDNNRDLWTVGYTPDLVTGVWVGNSDNQEIAQVLTTMTAAPIWHDFMETVLAGTPATDFERPDGLEEVKVCPTDGLLPNKYCPKTVTELFVKGTAPTKVCDIHRLVEVDKTTGNLATADTPPENREQKVVQVYPPDWQEWAKSAGLPPPPQAAPTATPAATAPQPIVSGDTNSSVIIQDPSAGATVRGEVEIHGTVSGKAFASYRVEFGEGTNPTSWTLVGMVHQMPVENGVVERWDTKGLNGAYKLRITLEEKPAVSPTAPPVPTGGPTPPTPTAVPTGPPVVRVVEVPVIVDNTPPSVSVASPAGNGSLSAGQKVTLTADVSDNYRVARTDFYVDDKPVGSSSSAPATVDWLPSQGQHVVRAVARDAAGNETKSADVKIEVK